MGHTRCAGSLPKDTSGEEMGAFQVRALTGRHRVTQLGPVVAVVLVRGLEGTGTCSHLRKPRP